MGKNALNYLLLSLVKIYRVFFSLIFGGNCRFYPSCSEYAEEALQKHSPSKAFFYILKRLSKCHPLGSSGIDLLPMKSSKSPHERNSHARQSKLS